jgi:hypothetical protein
VARGASAIIPLRKNAKPWKPDTAGPSPAPRSRACRITTVEPSGDDGADPAAAAEPKPGCTAFGFWVSARPRESSTARLQSSKPGCGQQRVRRARHLHHRGRRIALSGERGGPTITRLVQQSHSRLSVSLR